MSLQGHIQNGVVVFDEPIALPDGTQVRVEPITPAVSEFWHGVTLDVLAQRQGAAAAPAEGIVGGWPEDELNDGFEDAVALWRRRELEP